MVRSTSRHLMWLLFVMVIAACGDARVTGNTDLREEGDNSPRLSDEYFLVPAIQPQFVVNVTERAPLEVYLYSKRTGEAVPNQAISYQIVEGAEGVTLSALSTTTSETGSGSVDIRTGATPANILVRAEHVSSNAVDFKIEIAPLTVGGLRVTPVNTAPTIMQLNNVDVRMYREVEFTCNEFRPFGHQTEPITMQSTPSTGTPVLFEELGTREVFVLTAIARGPEGQIAAGGCIDGVQATADQVRDVELLMQLVPLNPVGTYDVIAHWDFVDAIADSGTVGSIVVRVLALFDNPGRAIYDEIINLVDALVGGIISGALDTFLSITNLDDYFENMINSFISNNEALTRLFRAGSDLRDVIANLQVHSELTIGKMSSTYEFRGSDNWLGITLYWRWNCAQNAPADCGAIPIIADANGEIGDLGVLSSEWTGRVVAYNNLQIDSHSVSLRYGRLITYVLNDIILPEMTDNNAHSLSEAFAYWIGCDRLASSITGSSGQLSALGATITRQQIESFCTSAVSTIFGFADLLVQALEFDLGLHLGGEGRLVETTSDGIVDRIEDGEFTGYMRSSDSSAPSSPFTATWTATRSSNDPGGL